MTFLKGLIISLAVAIALFILLMWACLKVASDYDDMMNYDDLMDEGKEDDKGRSN